MFKPFIWEILKNRKVFIKRNILVTKLPDYLDFKPQVVTKLPNLYNGGTYFLLPEILKLRHAIFNSLY